MSHNPYSAPTAQLKDADITGVSLYSPTQVAVGAFIGGPVGLIYFLRANFLALQNQPLVKKTLISGIFLILALIALLPFIPENFPNVAISIGYVLIARYVVENYQMKKEAIENSENYIFQSNWKVFGLSIVCLILSAVVIMVPVFGMVYLGII